VVNSQLDQYASISEGAHIENSTLINCIVDRGSVIKNCKLENSLIGRNAVLENISGTIVVGDDTQVRAR
jgi:NDP-sugar pyrophosphorylase family protein